MWIDNVNENGQPLRCVLRTGTMVLLYEKDPEELYACSQDELSLRLYKVTILSSMTVQGKYRYGIITLKHHMEARPSTELKAKNGLWKKNESLRPVIVLNHNQTKFLVEGVDFDLTVTGRIIFKK